MSWKKRLVADLLPYEKNPRKAKPGAMPALVESLQKWGIEDGAACSLQPLVVNRHAEFLDQILAGHRRLEACALGGIVEVWTKECSLDAAAMREVNARLNVAAGEWEWETLREEFDGEELVSWGFDDLEWAQKPTEDDVTLGGSTLTAGAAKPPAPTEDAPPGSRHGKQVLLFFSAENFDEYRALSKALAEQSDALSSESNASDVVLVALRISAG